MMIVITVTVIDTSRERDPHCAGQRGSSLSVAREWGESDAVHHE